LYLQWVIRARDEQVERLKHLQASIQAAAKAAGRISGGGASFPAPLPVDGMSHNPGLPAPQALQQQGWAGGQMAGQMPQQQSIPGLTTPELGSTVQQQQSLPVLDPLMGPLDANSILQFSR
jgi:hypothetical protein